jgi:hypothetical protein
MDLNTLMGDGSRFLIVIIQRICLVYQSSLWCRSSSFLSKQEVLVYNEVSGKKQ